MNKKHIQELVLVVEYLEAARKALGPSRTASFRSPEAKKLLQDGEFISDVLFYYYQKLSEMTAVLHRVVNSEIDFVNELEKSVRKSA